jgi:hypothetical protein
MILKLKVGNMGKIRVGNKQNSILNGEWAGHMRAWGKKVTAKIRRNVDKKVIRQELKEN